MAAEQEVLKIAKKLDKMVSKKSTENALDVLMALKAIPMNMETLQKTRIGLSVNSLRKQTKNDEIANAAKQLIKSWKKLVADGKDSTSESNSQAKQVEKKKVQKPEPVKAKVTPMVVQPTNDEVRIKCRDMIMRGLSVDITEDQKEVCEALSAAIEDAIFKEFNQTNMKYKNRVRSRFSNLKDSKNPELRQNVLSGTITPAKIAKMTPDEMASSEMKKARENFEKQNILDHQMATNEGTKTEMFTCGKCKGKSCTYNQLQTRSADEPMTTFVFCMDCGNRWKFC